MSLKWKDKKWTGQIKLSLTCPVVAKIHLLGGGLHGEVNGHKGHDEGGQVAQQVGRVRHDGNAVGQVATHRLTNLSQQDKMLFYFYFYFLLLCSSTFLH